MGMETKIPRRKPSKLFIAALSLSVAAHLALFVAIQLTPKRENDLKKSYDYISSAVWEVFGPTSVIKVIEFNWPTGLEGEERPSCVDIESALDGLDLDRSKVGWCTPESLEKRGGVGQAILALDSSQTQ
jgi:hypothetical protein